LKERIIKIGITIGDPAGIGPEVALKAVNELRELNYSPVVIGRSEAIEKNYPALLKKYSIIRQDQIHLSENVPGKKYLLDMPSNYPVPSPGIGSPETGGESCAYIDKAVELWKIGLLDAVVTGPVSKANIEKSGIRFTGHTDYIAGLIREKDPLMLMYSGDYRVLLVTAHIPVEKISESIDAGRIYKTILTGYQWIKSVDPNNTRIAIAGLDPHCGDEGAIGSFDMNVTKKAVEKARAQGIDIRGPYSADSLFTPGKWKSYNLAIAHYHDQGLIPFKALAFDSGVNVTLGLSIIRTSPDHGTAFDIAGKNRANHKSMSEAIKLARRLAENKRSLTA
jgi:4-hydroxythreonine-4-phosphate dehydrogenase